MPGRTSWRALRGARRGRGGRGRFYGERRRVPGRDRAPAGRRDAGGGRGRRYLCGKRGRRRALALPAAFGRRGPRLPPGVLSPAGRLPLHRGAAPPPQRPAAARRGRPARPLLRARRQGAAGAVARRGPRGGGATRPLGPRRRIRTAGAARARGRDAVRRPRRLRLLQRIVREPRRGRGLPNGPGPRKGRRHRASHRTLLRHRLLGRPLRTAAHRGGNRWRTPTGPSGGDRHGGTIGQGLQDPCRRRGRRQFLDRLPPP
mmetsp:Transcript_46338/g.90482  ORF Transcript_46338/g.90482 Transcript_46338/m.90482 type:complete len:259 (+) Transcript_46338:266-1042(+)